MVGIFKAYDIRGTVPDQLNEEIVEKIGKAFATINPGIIAVGIDARLTGPLFKEKLIKGLVSAGAKVIDIGMVSTPMLIFSVGSYGYDGGIMITGSHTPENYNGFKFYIKNAVSMSYDNGIDRIEKLVESEGFKTGEGSLENKDVLDDYKNFIVKNFNFTNDKRLKIVIDGANGSSGKIHSDIIRSLGFDVVELFCEPDGNFPGHSPDPMNHKNLEKIRELVKEEKADLGFAYDGDGDRLVVILSNGKIIDSNKLYVVLIKHILSNNKDETVIHDALCSKMIEDAVEKYGGKLRVCKVGHSFVAQMLDEGGIFAGELSGHYFFKETFNQDDVLFASLKLLEFLVNNDTTLEKEIEEIPEYYSDVSETNRVEIKESEKFKFIDELKEKYKDEYKIDDLDGVKIIFDDGWLLFRPSNTEPKIAYVFESTTKEGLERIREFTNKILETVPK